MALAFSLEKRVAISAVLRACSLTSAVFQKLVKNETLTKDDKSPVTGNFNNIPEIRSNPSYSGRLFSSSGNERNSVQGFPRRSNRRSVFIHSYTLLCSTLLGEEDSADLRNTLPATLQLRSHLTSLANDAIRAPLQRDEDPAWGIGPASAVRSTEELLAQIDRGNYEGGSKGRE